VTIAQAYRSSTSITFTASPANQPSYNWRLSSGWTSDKTTGPFIIVYHHNKSGMVELSYETFCGGAPQQAMDYYSYSPPGGDGGGDGGGSGGCEEPLPLKAYPNPTTNLLAFEDPCGEIPVSVMIEENGTFKPIETRRDGSQHSIDVSALKPGLHIIRVSKSRGQDQYIRFMKSK
jgi:hypothetical protein